MSGGEQSMMRVDDALGAPMNHVEPSDKPGNISGVTAHINISACYVYKRRTLFLDLKWLDTLTVKFGPTDQVKKLS